MGCEHGKEKDLVLLKCWSSVYFFYDNWMRYAKKV